MNAKERVLMSLNHQEPDRCPINFRATDAIVDVVCKHYKKDYYGLLDYLNVDFREVFADYAGPKFKKLDDGTQLDMWGVGRQELITELSRDVYVNYSPLLQTLEIIIGHRLTCLILARWKVSVTGLRAMRFQPLGFTPKGIMVYFTY